MPVLYCKIRNQRSEEIITQRTTSGILTGKIYMIIKQELSEEKAGKIIKSAREIYKTTPKNNNNEN